MCTWQKYANWLYCSGVAANVAWRALFSRSCQLAWNGYFALLIEQVLGCTQAIMKDENPDENLTVAVTAREIQKKVKQSSLRASNDIICHRCNDLIHFPKDCKSISRGGKFSIRCYNCDKMGLVPHPRYYRKFVQRKSVLPSFSECCFLRQTRRRLPRLIKEQKSLS